MISIARSSSFASCPFLKRHADVQQASLCVQRPARCFFPQLSSARMCSSEEHQAAEGNMRWRRPVRCASCVSATLQLVNVCKFGVHGVAVIIASRVLHQQRSPPEYLLRLLGKRRLSIACSFQLHCAP